ncbi:MAG: CehA/McbA family metallohydrolase [Planctomycetes bacterium]|nr:CehA/McbA family metallohydrolase [Planctomycetota bacterium]
MGRTPGLFLVAFLLLSPAMVRADKLEVVGDVDAQPLGQNADRLMKSLDFLGFPLPGDVAKQLTAAVEKRDAKKIQEILDERVLLQVSLNPEARVKVSRGPAEATIQQAGFVPFLVKVVNDSTVKKVLNITSPQAGPVYSGQGLQKKDGKADPKVVSRFLHLEMHTSPPMTTNLSGIKVEYAIALIYSSEAGKREATIGFDVGQGTQDLGFRGETPVLFDVKPGIPVRLVVTDFDGKPTVGRFLFKDAAGHVYPPQAKRLAPDLFFQQQIYRNNGGTVLLPPGELTMEFGRGPEYQLITRKIKVTGEGSQLTAQLKRWINPMDFGWYNGDHHIHAAGCKHYTNPAEGVLPEDMFLHVKGEGMNVGCCLTWGPCYEYQRQFNEPTPHKLSEPLTILKYDVEVSGFGSQALGHVCLLNLRDQTYPGSEGTKTKGWPTWTTPLMRWAKLQGAVTGYAHSGNGLGINPAAAAKRLIDKYDTNKDAKLSLEETKSALLPHPFATIDRNGDGSITELELVQAHEKAATELPNLAIPEMNGIGAQEICVTSAMRVCDFISAMDTQRIPEWNCWYQIMNCGFPLKASGETDFPCITGTRVGQGRVYVQMGKIDKIDYTTWCEGIAKGRSYVSDGYSHALEFTVNGKPMGDEVKLDAAGKVTVKAKVAFASELPLGTAVGGAVPEGKTRKVELIVNGQVAESKEVPADDKPHDLEFSIPIAKSSWVAIRHFPSLHTNPVNVTVAGKPIRASKQSVQWCIGVIEQLWKVRGTGILQSERGEAEKTFEKALEIYRQIEKEVE